MKISKIDHTRTAQSTAVQHKENHPNSESGRTIGVLYDVPSSSEDAVRNLESHVENRINKAKSLYGVFCTEAGFCAEKEKKIIFERMALYFNSVVKAALDRGNGCEKDAVRYEKEQAFFCAFADQAIPVRKDILLGKSMRIFIDNPIDKNQEANSQQVADNKKRMRCTPELGIEMCHELVAHSLKGTLRKEIKQDDGQFVSLPALIEQLLKAVCVDGNTSGLEPQKVNDFFRQVDWDYRKKNEKKDQAVLLTKSIEHQSTHVKTCERDGKILLTLANADHPKKKYVFEFLCKYAAADEKGKERLCVHMMELIALYVNGSAEYSLTGFEWKKASENKCFFENNIQNAFSEIQSLKESIVQCKKKLSADREAEEKASSRSGSTAKSRTLSSNRSGNSADESKKGKLSEEEKKKLKLQKKEESRKIDQLKAMIHEVTLHTMSQRYRDAVSYLCTQNPVTVFGENTSAKTCSSADLYWIDFIDDTVKNILLDKASLQKDYRFERGYLCRHIYKTWTQFIATKYVQLGKAVYHFAVPDLSKVTEGQEIRIEEVLPEYQKGISGFEYERIKAEESLEREIAEYVSFAIHNFSRVCTNDEERSRGGYEDVLQLKVDSECLENSKARKIQLYNDADRRILQFFGGKSRFTGNEESYIALISKEELFCAIRDEMNNVRNMSFHYTAKTDTSVIDHSIAKQFLEEEMSSIGNVYNKKYYSNNVHLFYGVSTIQGLMNQIYSGRKYRAAQIPAFNKIISRPSMPSVAGPFIKGKFLRKLQNNLDRTVIERYWSSLFFVLKELYYNDFLQEHENPQDNIKERFLRALDQQMESETRPNEKKALESFNQRIDEIGRDKTFGEICQGLMIEYMLQNNEDMKVRKQSAEQTRKNNGKTPKDYQSYNHYRTLLYICIREAFLTYLREKWDILRTPEYQHEKMSEEEFTVNCQIGMFTHLNDVFHEDASAASWYITAHFMNPKYLNHLIGSLRNYLQFTNDIERRAESIHNRVDVKLGAKQKKYENILETLEFALNFCGKTTNVIEDYFSDDQEYAQFLSEFVDYKKSKKEPDIVQALHVFCDSISEKNDNTEVPNGIYCIGSQIIPNRNVILANMYGATSRLKRSMKKITQSEIYRMYTAKKELDPVLKRGICTTKEEQANLRNFQNMKNRIELLDLTIYTEFLNDLQAQLVSWSYLRERDFMYYQLGYYYTKLYWTDQISEDDSRRKLEGDGIHITAGAMLYEILAINSYTLPLVVNSKKVETIAENARVGIKKEILEKHFLKGKDYLAEGKEMFENTQEEKDITTTRNYIDHFKYFSHTDRSMLDLYSEVYDRFFRYDHNLKKSVSFVLPNILANYFVEAGFTMEPVKKKVAGNEHDAAKFVISDKGLKSTQMTYRIQPVGENKKDVLIDARSDQFLKQLHSILES